VKQRRAKQGSIEKQASEHRKKIKLLVRSQREEKEKNKQPQEVAKPCVTWQGCLVATVKKC